MERKGELGFYFVVLSQIKLETTFADVMSTGIYLNKSVHLIVYFLLFFKGYEFIFS